MYNDSLILGHATVMNNTIVFAKTNNFIISAPKINYNNYRKIVRFFLSTHSTTLPSPPSGPAHQMYFCHFKIYVKMLQTFTWTQVTSESWIEILVRISWFIFIFFRYFRHSHWSIVILTAFTSRFFSLRFCHLIPWFTLAHSNETTQ